MTFRCSKCNGPMDNLYSTWCINCIGNSSKIPPTAFITWDDEVTKKIDLNDLFKDKQEPKKQSYYCYPHLWVEYTGLNERFWYCKYCDCKRDK